MPAVLITGAKGGIGRATVRALLDRGLTVYAGTPSVTTQHTDPRDEANTRRAADADLSRAIPIHLDVTDAASVAAAAREISSLEGGRGLHAVVNNAGIIV